MKITTVDGSRFNNPMLKELKPGVMVKFQNHVYIKLDKKKLGKGICMQWTDGYSVLFNPTYGTTREVDAESRVEVLEQVADLEVYVLTKQEQINKYRRC